MSNTVENLKKEHANIANRLLQVNRLGIDTREGRGKLMETKDQLLNYLQRGDSKLPPGIVRIARENPRLNQMLVDLKNDTEEFTRFCENFFEKYSTDNSGCDMFRDFKTLQRSLEVQMQKEERLLYAGIHLAE